MSRIIVLVLALALAGCAHKLEPQQVNRAAKSDKYAAPKVVQKIEQPTPNQKVKKRWFEGFKVRLFHK